MVDRKHHPDCRHPPILDVVGSGSGPDQIRVSVRGQKAFARLTVVSSLIPSVRNCISHIHTVQGKATLYVVKLLAGLQTAGGVSTLHGLALVNTPPVKSKLHSAVMPNWVSMRDLAAASMSFSECPPSFSRSHRGPIKEMRLTLGHVSTAT